MDYSSDPLLLSTADSLDYGEPSLPFPETANADEDRVESPGQGSLRIEEALALDIYSRDLGSKGLLKPEEEADLGAQIDVAIVGLLRRIMVNELYLDRLELVLLDYLHLYQGKNGMVATKWRFPVSPEEVETMVVTLLDQLRVLFHIGESASADSKRIRVNLAWLVNSLTLGRQRLVALAEELESEGVSESVAARVLESEPDFNTRDYLQLRNRLIESNLRLVYLVASKFRNTGIAFEDLIQEGNMGLIKASDRFNFATGNRFSTYAVFCIQNVLKTALQKRYHLIARPSYLQEKLSTISAAEKRHFNEKGVLPTLEQLSEHTGIPVSTLQRIKSFPQVSRSLNQPVFRDDEETLEAMIADTSADLEAVTEPHLQRKLIDRLSTALTEKEIRVLRLRFGIGCRREHTLQEVASQMGVSVERVRQVQKNALAKLVQHANASGQHFETTF